MRLRSAPPHARFFSRRGFSATAELVLQLCGPDAVHICHGLSHSCAAQIVDAAPGSRLLIAMTSYPSFLQPHQNACKYTPSGAI
jgi:hypothetical protein